MTFSRAFNTVIKQMALHIYLPESCHGPDRQAGTFFLFCVIRTNHLGKRDSRRTLSGLVLSLFSPRQCMTGSGTLWIFGRRAEHLDRIESLNMSRVL